MISQVDVYRLLLIFTGNNRSILSSFIPSDFSPIGYG